MARDLAWDWIGDAHERFSVGDQVLVRILSVRRDSLEDIGIRAGKITNLIFSSLSSIGEILVNFFKHIFVI